MRQLARHCEKTSKMNAIEPFNFNTNSIKDADKLIPPSLLDSLKSFTTQEHRYDALRAIIYGKLNHLSRQILQDSAEWRNMSLEAKCQLISEIQECFYDLQLVEQAGKQPLLSLARATFSLNKRRCAAKALPVKSKPMKKQKLDAALRRRERDAKSPSISTKHATGDDAPNNHSDDRNGTGNDTTSSRRRGGSNRDRAANHASTSRSRQDCMHNSNNNDAGRQDRATPSNENSGGVCKPDDAEDAGANDVDNTVSPLPDSAPPKRRAAALAAAVSVAETVNPHRSNSPRKRTAGANIQADDEVSGDGSGISAVTEEPTYCICEQISFGDMICCDYSKCPIEWFHFACVNIKLKPKGKKWFCPLCRGDKPTVLKSSLQSRR